MTEKPARDAINRTRVRDWYPPLTPRDDVAEIKAEEARRIHALGDLPDIDMTCFASLEEYVEWVMEGAQRFSAG